MDRTTIETYNQIAAEYDREVADFWKRHESQLIKKFVSAAGPKILDIGCGSGRDAIILSNNGKDVLCLDASDAMVQICKSKGLAATCADYHVIPYNDVTFDGVWAYTSILHSPKAEIVKVVQEIRRVLCPDGVLALGLIEGDYEGYRNSAGPDLLRWFSFYNKSEIEKIFSMGGFKINYFEEMVLDSKKYLHFILQKV